MNNVLYQFFTNDHRRLEKIFDVATEIESDIKEELYHQFRVGILKHIKMEEKILFPAAQKANGGVPIPLAAKLKLDHGAITSLMVVPPSPDVIKVIRYILELHDELEEKEGGMYAICEQLTENDTQAILAQLENATDVPVHPYNTAGYALDVAKRTLLRAGFDFDEIVKNG
ncbi:MAG: hemerythrin domain-containing protein [Chitinophagales bacterium]|nr:hemerythrin domain-containing protein [Chitinophagales bacterium]